MKYLPLVWRNLMRRKTRTIFTVLSIVVAFVLFGVLAALNTAFSMGVELAGNDRLIITHKVSLIQLLPESYPARLETTPGVVEVLHQTWFGGIYQKPSNFFMQCPVHPEKLLKLYPRYVLPEDQKKAWLDRPHAARSSAARRRTGSASRSATASRSRRRSGASGTTRPTGSSTSAAIYDGDQQGRRHDAVLLPLRVLRRGAPVRPGAGRLVRDPHRRSRHGARDREAHRRAVRQLLRRDQDDDGEGVRAGVREADRRHRRDHPRRSSRRCSSRSCSWPRNTMAQSVRERTSELAVLKTLGFTDGLVLTLVLVESCAIAVLGGGIGLGLAWLITRAATRPAACCRRSSCRRRTCCGASLFALGLGVVAGHPAGVQAMRLRIVDALRRT